MASEMLAMYIGLSRVRTKEAFLIPQPFLPGLFLPRAATGLRNLDESIAQGARSR